ncbi:TPA: hypothetical protein ACIAJC_004711 [Citrobacter freundii]
MNTDVKAIFEQSRTLENLEGAAVLMRSLDKAPSSLRALSDFVMAATGTGLYGSTNLFRLLSNK